MLNTNFGDGGVSPTLNFEKMHLASLGSDGDGEHSANFW